MKKEKYVVVEILIQRRYMFPKNHGMTEEDIKAMFKNFSLNRSHATRDACEVGEKFKKIVSIKEKEIEFVDIEVDVNEALGRKNVFRETWKLIGNIFNKKR